MIRDINSARSKKWINRNDLNSAFCKEYVDNLCCVQFNFKIYNFSIFNNNASLYITYGLNSYVIYVDNSVIGLKLMEKNKNNDSYHELLYFYGDNCWFDCFLWIKNRI